MNIDLAHAFACSSDDFWTAFLDPDITRAMIVEGLGFADCRVEKLVDDASVLERNLQITPKLELPAVVAKLVGPRLVTREHGTFDKASHVYRWSSRTDVLGDRFSIAGQMRVEPLPGRHCRRVAEMKIEASVFGIGRLVEQAAASNVRSGWDRSATWLARHVANSADGA